jgi:hypothetical protein
MAISVRRFAVQASALAVSAVFLAGCNVQPDGPKNDVPPTREAPKPSVAAEASEPVPGLPTGITAPSGDQRIGAALNSEGGITVVAIGAQDSPVKIARVGANGQVVRVLLFTEDAEAKGQEPSTTTIKVPDSVDLSKQVNVVFTGLPDYRGNSVLKPGKVGDLSVGDVDWAQMRELP